MKIVLDTNVLISGLLSSDGTPGKILTACLDGYCELVLSASIVQEIGRVLAYPKINKILGWDHDRIKEYVLLLQLFSDNVDIDHINVTVPKDKNDNHILATFLSSKADFLVTDDSDLLALSNKYSIITPTEFLNHIW